MNDLWKDEPTPLTDAAAIHYWNMPDGTPMQTPMTENELVVHARDLERRLRHSKRLMRDLLRVLPRGSCEDFHHIKKDQHELGQPCPPFLRYRERINAAHAWLSAAKEEV